MSITDQPPPIPNESVPVWDLVIRDMQERDHVGRERYGTPLQTFNGREALVDAYQEGLDFVVYIRQAIEEDRVRQAGIARGNDEGIDFVQVDRVATLLLNTDQPPRDGSPLKRLGDYMPPYVRRLRAAAIRAITGLEDDDAVNRLVGMMEPGVDSPA